MMNTWPRYGAGWGLLPCNVPTEGNLGWCRIWEKHGVEQVYFTGSIQIYNWLCVGSIQYRQDGAHLYTVSEVAQQRNNGSCPYSTHPISTQFSLFLYVSCTSQAAEPLPTSRESICEKANLCMGPLRGHLIFKFLSSHPEGQNPQLFL